MPAAERYFELTGKRYVYNIMPIDNIPSVLQHGILCFDMMAHLQHTSIAMNDVQTRRSRVEIPNGHSLHQYANLYFSFRNPMISARRNIASQLCILAISTEVMNLDGCIFSDRNAAASLVRFYSPMEGMQHLDFRGIHAEFWTDPNPIIQREKKTIKCAEVLIPHRVAPEYIAGAYVINENAAAQLKSNGFNKRIVVNPDVFF